nr:hypothetical protein [Tanacetum cinerariifolium]
MVLEFKKKFLKSTSDYRQEGKGFLVIKVNVKVSSSWLVLRVGEGFLIEENASGCNYDHGIKSGFASMYTCESAISTPLCAVATGTEIVRELKYSSNIGSSVVDSESFLLRACNQQKYQYRPLHLVDPNPHCHWSDNRVNQRHKERINLASCRASAHMEFCCSEDRSGNDFRYNKL